MSQLVLPESTPLADAFDVLIRGLGVALDAVISLRNIPRQPFVHAFAIARRVLLPLAGTAGGALAIIYLLLTLLPQTRLYATFTVLSSSMEPSIHEGSVVVVVPVDPRSIHVGDVISYTAIVPPFPTITHRVVGTNADLSFKTRGDANVVEDPWEVRYSGSAGRVVLALPLLGYLLADTATLPFRVGLGLLLAGLLAFFWLTAVWLRPRAAAAVTAVRQDFARRDPAAPAEFSTLRLAIFAWLVFCLVFGLPRRLARL